MMDMTTRAQVTNEQVAKDLGITHSMVSRIRTGDREPSLRLIRTIEEVMGWPINDQAVNLDHNYAKAFETVLERHYG